MIAIRVAGALSVLLAVAGCQSAEKCNSWSAAGAGGASWSQCGDKKERKVECELVPRPGGPGAPKPAKCTCTLDGVVGKSFDTTDPMKLATKENATSIANEQCGWHLQ